MHETYPTITIVKEVPYMRGMEESSCGTTLNPNARSFEPSEDVESQDIGLEHVQFDEDNVEEEVALAEKKETNLPEDTLEENVRNLPVKELNSEAVEVINDVSTEEFIRYRTEPVEGKDVVRKEDNESEILIEENVEKNGNTPVEEIPEQEFRRSTRVREPPDRLTYTSLGNPLVLVMQSLLSGLNKAFTQALEPDNFPEVRILTPDRSIII